MGSWYDQQEKRSRFNIEVEEDFARTAVAMFVKLGWRQTVARGQKPFYLSPTNIPDGTTRTVLDFGVEFPDTEYRAAVHISGEQEIPEEHREGLYKPDARYIYVVQNGTWVLKQ